MEGGRGRDGWREIVCEREREKKKEKREGGGQEGLSESEREAE